MRLDEQGHLEKRPQGDDGGIEPFEESGLERSGRWPRQRHRDWASGEVGAGAFPEDVDSGREEGPATSGWAAVGTAMLTASRGDEVARVLEGAHPYSAAAFAALAPSLSDTAAIAQASIVRNFCRWYVPRCPMPTTPMRILAMMRPYRQMPRAECRMNSTNCRISGRSVTSCSTRSRATASRREERKTRRYACFRA